MRTRGEKRLVTLVVVVSLGLTGLTVWSVARQGRALAAREHADLRNAAGEAAALQLASLRADVLRTCDAALRVWQAAGRDGLDVWAGERSEWTLVGLSHERSTWELLPQAALDLPLPGPRDPNELGPPTQRYDLNATLEHFRRLATDPDPATRAGALFASAQYEQQLGHPLAAARILGDAADLLRGTPGLARFAPRAELWRIDALLTAGDLERTRAALGDSLTHALAAHPGRTGPAELRRLEQQAAGLGLTAADALHAQLAALTRRVAAHSAARATAQAALAGGVVPHSPENGDVAFVAARSAAGESFVLALRLIGANTCLALLAPADDLLVRYRPGTATDVAWEIVPLARPGDLVLAALGPAFGDAVLVPTTEARARLRATERRRWGVLVATGLGTVTAWALVIWMMVRAMARQRQLAHLQSRFVADMSHELKTPLALIRLLAETLAEGRMRDPERVREYHQTITRESERLTALLDNILDLGRIESGRKVYRFGPCDVAAVTQQAWALFEPQFARDGFDARLTLAPHLSAIRADAAALQQVLVNLLQNAYRYAGDGKFVRLSVRAEGAVIVFRVEDHGIGMNRAQLQRLGESFFRAEDTRVRQTRGTGLGLAIVNHIITAHHGRVEVQSRPNAGTTFTVWIPVAPPPDEAPPSR